MNKNQYPRWLNLLVIGIVLVGTLLALPNWFGDAPGLQIGLKDRGELEAGFADRVRQALEADGFDVEHAWVADDRLVVRFPADTADGASRQKAAQEAAQNTLGADYLVALTRPSRAPDVLRNLGLNPMNLGLDLRGGVHFLYKVDMPQAIEQSRQIAEADIKRLLREEDADYRSVQVEGESIRVVLRDEADLDRAENLIRTENQGYLLRRAPTANGGDSILVDFSQQLLTERQTNAIEQNITTIRNRVNELGVAEPLVQRQGVDRIVVQLPGMQDPSYAKKILSATATVEFRGEYENADPFAAQADGRAPPGSRLYEDKGGVPALLKRDVIASGQNLTDANQGLAEGQPAVFVKLDAGGAKRMLRYTQDNLNKRMAVVFIDKEPAGQDDEGNPIFRTTERIISLATIRGVFSNSFQITGLTISESQELALLLRAGSLAAPISVIEERTVGPSLGQDNIDRGFNAIRIGFLAVVIFMLVYYRLFGLFANLALLVNVVMIVAMLSLLNAALTLPGIAGIVLTVGMAVDANVLIFERIREELRNGNSPQASIHAGYEKAFSSIADANITTFIAALVLFFQGTGPIKGFAIVLAIGIATSMFTAIIGTRALANVVYGNRSVAKLSI